MKTFVQESRYFNSTESDLVHPSRASGLVNSGDPVVVGRVVGVASSTALATTDLIAIDTEGVHDLTVSSIHNGISVGETVYIDPVSAVVSDDFTDVPFGVCYYGNFVGAGSGTVSVRLFGATPGATGANS
jgi:predicted RecA/RadA family phage recombinase